VVVSKPALIGGGAHELAITGEIGDPLGFAVVTPVGSVLSGYARHAIVSVVPETTSVR
jgi:hypothetical protein